MYEYPAESRPEFDSAPLKVVVADDDAVQRAYISAILRKLGHEPHEALDGCQALELLRRISAKILVCDLDMPGLNGYELARQIREEPGDGYVHILMVTGQNQRLQRERALEAGVDDFMGKPVDTASLTARIRSADRLLRHEQLLLQRSAVLARAKERIEDDLRAAADAQRRLLPPAHKDVAGCKFHSAFKPSNILSGDMFGYYRICEGFTAFYAIDVAGHGVHASLMSVALGHLLTSELFRAHSFDGAGHPDPAALVSVLSDRFYREDGTEYFTMFCGMIEHGADRLHYCQAGYPSPYMLTRGGSVRQVGTGGFPVALLAGVPFETSVTSFAADEFLVLCSDGAMEAENRFGEPFDEMRVKAALAEAAAAPETIPDGVVSALERWRGGRTLDDDLTVLVCERTPKQ
ncbi:PP2C family protein-serine/threonine phosphatase [Mangrovicoccus sp. HB161399]|uniref:PP2C family protein-serine/threonine phosphatase n=1 Tax=Mangrovicoccus sp. HB161399 TaxID=2720392 RepID=UPI001556B1F0|nr:SpoIIE family protein phosphatase [Mangrovicoccus sp. HB161399]